jgi:hypothetical protein
MGTLKKRKRLIIRMLINGRKGFNDMSYTKAFRVREADFKLMIFVALKEVIVLKAMMSVCGRNKRATQ